jgi:hypothetical protein
MSLSEAISGTGQSADQTDEAAPQQQQQQENS